MIGLTVIGIDCATDYKKVGLARALWKDGVAQVLKVKTGSRNEPPVKIVTDWIVGGRPALIAIDAPLGWPIELSRVLSQHKAGEPINVAPNDFFRRTTDRVVREKLGRQPLDVGADRIARTAHAALELLEDLRRATGQPIPLGWSREVEEVVGIEVYPAATLMAYDLQSAKYKGKGRDSSRSTMVEGLRRHLRLSEDVVSPMISKDDALDAVVCVLAAVDFLLGRVVQPENRELAEKEGWIWFRPEWSGAIQRMPGPNKQLAS